MDQVCLLYDPTENLSRAILSILVGLDEISHGQLYIDGKNQAEFLQQGMLLHHFAYMFDEGIMLANLSLRENLNLPLHWLKPGLSVAETIETIDYWMDFFHLELDLSQRPAAYLPGKLKLLSYVRGLILDSHYLLLDDPFYILNKEERIQLFGGLLRLKPERPMLIASIDDEFGLGFADEIIDLSEKAKNFGTVENSE